MTLTPDLERRMFADALFHASCAQEFRKGAKLFDPHTRGQESLIRTAVHHERQVRQIADRVIVYLKMGAEK